MSSKRWRRSPDGRTDAAEQQDETAAIDAAIAAVRACVGVLAQLKEAARPTKRSPELIEARKQATRAVAALGAASKLAVYRRLRSRLPELTPDAPGPLRPLLAALTSTAEPHETPKQFPAYLTTYSARGFDYEPFRQANGETALTRLYKARLDRERHQSGQTPDTPAVEIFYGDVLTARDVTVDEPSIVPVSALDGEARLHVDRPGAARKTLTIGNDGFSFVPVPPGRSRLAAAGSPLAIGRPMALKAAAAGRPPLVLSIFLDGLSGSVFDQVPLGQLMPNTHAYFEGHAVTASAHAVAEWTLPNIASIMTGLRPYQHRVVHPSAPADVFEADRPYWPAAIRAAGYNTAQFCSNWRKSPGYGYAQGFDRTVYHRGGMSAETVIAEAVEHLDVFRERPNYLWLTFFDLHHDLGSGPSFLAASAGQVDDPTPRVKSVRMDVSEGLVEKYILKIRRLDLMLGALYDFLERRYGDEIRVGLFSDHGVSFLSYETVRDYLRVTDTRCRVPMMFRGEPFQGGALPEFSQNLDHFRTLFTGVAPVLDQMAAFAGRSGDLDLTVAARDHAITESIYPRQHYLFRYTDAGGSHLHAGDRLYRRKSDEPLAPKSFVRRSGEWTPGEMPAAAIEALRLREAALAALH